MDGNKIRVLIVEDDLVDQMAYDRFIKKESLQYEYTFADSVESAKNKIASNTFDIVISDFMLGDGTALDVFPEVKDLPMIVVTGTGNEDTAVKAMKLGVSDYLIKDPGGFFLKTLPLTVKNAIARRNTESELKRYRENLESLVNERTKKLKESEEQYRTLITRMINPFALQEVICDENGHPCNFRFLEVNSAFEDMAASKKEEMVGRAALDIFPEMDRTLIEKFGKVALKGDSVHFEYYDEKSDKYFEILVYSPKADQFATIFTDITARKNTEKENKILEKQLLHTQKMEALGTLAGGIAHDFNNILSIIFGYIELATLDILKPDKIKDDIEEIKNASYRARDLINQILTVCRKTKHEKQYVKIAPIIEETVKLLKSTIPKSIQIEHVIDTDKTALADPSQIHQVIMNLCTNAYHAMRENGGTLTVLLNNIEIIQGSSIRGQDIPPGNYIGLEVIDTGYGMNEKTKEKIFDPYFTTKEIGEGTGLGLAVVHGIVKSHNGFIAVFSREGAGTKFYIYLPVAEKMAESNNIENTQRVARRGTERILIVDDEKSITNITDKILSKYGYKITVFNSSVLAYEEFRKNPDLYDLIITDMTMPQMNGMELAKKILGIKPGKPIIICSGFSNLINNEKASDMGLFYVSKPVAMNDMMRIIREIFDNV